MGQSTCCLVFMGLAQYHLPHWKAENTFVSHGSVLMLARAKSLLVDRAEFESSFSAS